jgi:hypothetical protein
VIVYGLGLALGSVGGSIPTDGAKLRSNFKPSHMSPKLAARQMRTQQPGAKSRAKEPGKRYSRKTRRGATGERERMGKERFD